MRVPMRYRPETRPSSTPLQPFNVQPVQMARGDGGIGQALAGLADGLSRLGATLEEQRTQNSRLEGMGALARFQAEQATWLDVANRDFEQMANIDTVHHGQFIEKAEALVASLPQEQQEWATGQLLSVYQRNQIRAGEIERRRNEQFAKQAITRNAETIAAAVRSNPEIGFEEAERFLEGISLSVPPSRERDDQFVDPRDTPQVRDSVRQRFAGRTLPVSIRNNNMGAISITGNVQNSWAARQPGFVGTSPRPANEGGHYAKYATPVHGVAAASRLLESYGSRGINTVNQIVSRWAAEPGAYASVVTRYLNDAGFAVDADTALDLADPRVREAVLKGKSHHEAGAGEPVYTDDVFQRGVRYELDGAANVVNRVDMQDLGEAGYRTIINAMVQGLIEQDPAVAEERLASGEFDGALSASQKNTLVNQAQAAIFRDQREAAQVRAAEVKVVTDQLAMHEDEMWKNDVSPQWDNVRREAAELGGEEGQMIAERIDFLEGVDSVHRQFVNSPPIERARVLQELNAKRASGQLPTQNQIDFHELLKQSHKRIQQQAEKDGYSFATQQGVVEPSGATLLETLGSDPAGLALRDQQAAAIKRSYGPNASIMTQEEMEQIRNFAAESDAYMLAVMNAVVDHPFLRDELKREFANDDAGIAAAFDIAAQGDTDTAQSIIRGRRLLDLGLVSNIPANIQLEAAVSVFGNTFTGIDAAEAEYLRAAHLYYVGNLSRDVRKERQLIDGRMPANPSTPQLVEALQAVLPGQIEAHNGRSFITPSRDIGSREMKQIFRDLRGNENWWQDHAVWYDGGGNLVQLDSPPTYPDGTPITIEDILDRGELATLDEGGLYRVFVDSGYIANEQFNLALDLSAWANWGREEFRNFERRLNQQQSPAPLRSRSPGDTLARERRVQSIPGARLDSSGARQ